MSLLDPKSLRGLLTLRLTMAQGAMLALVWLVYFALFGSAWYFGFINAGKYGRAVPQAVSAALYRDSEGALRLNDTEQLRKLRTEDPAFWLIVRDENGRTLTEGDPPSQVQPIIDIMNVIGYADLGQSYDQDAPPVATLQWSDSRAGWVQILSAGSAKVGWIEIFGLAHQVFYVCILLSGLLGLATFIATPFIVRRAFRGLDKIAAKAGKINIEQSGERLSSNDVPLEILPFVNAVNDALARLDKGYEGHKRFLTDAAHELRTPIAILTTRLSALPSSPLRARLLEDSARLTALAGQLLDLQRMEQQKVPFEPVDLVELARRTVMDLAPLAFGAGYELAFEPEVAIVIVRGDAVAIERALTNLVQNAINYGGRQGTILVRVGAAGWLEVCDEGAGIPEAEREQIFEAFHRLRQDGRGVGLGLDLVQKIMRLHGGRAEVTSTSGQGACFKLIFPV